MADVAGLNLVIGGTITGLNTAINGAVSGMNKLAPAANNAANGVNNLNTATNNSATAIAGINAQTLQAARGFGVFNSAVTSSIAGQRSFVTAAQQGTLAYGAQANAARSAGQAISAQSSIIGSAVKNLASSVIGGGIGAAVTLAASALSGLIAKYGDLSFYLSDAQKLQESFNKTVAAGIGDAAGETAKLEGLLSVVRDETLARDQRLRAVKLIQKEYPDYLGNLSLENASTEQIKTATDKLTEALIRQAKVKGAQELISKEQQKILEAQNESLFKQAGVWGVVKASFLGFGSVSKGLGVILQEGIDNQNEAVAKATKNSTRLQQIINDTLKIDAQSGTLGFGDKLDKAGTSAEASGRKIRTAADVLKILNAELSATDAQIKDMGGATDALIGDKINALQKAFENLIKTGLKPGSPELNRITSQINLLSAAVIGKVPLQVANIQALGKALREIKAPNLSVEQLQGVLGVKDTSSQLQLGQSPIQVAPVIKENAGLENIDKFQQQFNERITKLKEDSQNTIDNNVVYYGKWTSAINGAAVDQGKALQGLAASAAEGLGEVIGGVISGTSTLGESLYKLVNVMGAFISDFGKSLIQAATLKLIASKLAYVNPYAALAVGVAAVALGSVLKNKVPSFATGGIVNGPTLAMVGDNPSGREAMIPEELWPYLGGGGGQVMIAETRLSGRDIVISYKRSAGEEKTCKIMAYVLKYRMSFTDRFNGIKSEWRIDILSDSAVSGPIIILQPADSPLILSYLNTDESKTSWIVGRSATIRYAITGAEGEPLPDVFFDKDEREHQVNIYRNGVLDGVYWVKPDGGEYPYAHSPYYVEISAVDGLAYAQGLLYKMYEDGKVVYEKRSIRKLVSDAIYACVEEGTIINVINSLRPAGFIASENMMEQVKAHTDMFFDFTTGPKSIYEILEIFCKTFYARIFLAAGKAWFIRTPDLFESAPEIKNIDGAADDTNLQIIVSPSATPAVINTPNIRFVPALKKADFKINYRAINQLKNFDWFDYSLLSGFTFWPDAGGSVSPYFQRAGTGDIADPFTARALFVDGSLSRIQQKTGIDGVDFASPGQLVSLDLKYKFTNTTVFRVAVIADNTYAPGGKSYTLGSGGEWTEITTTSPVNPIELRRSGIRREGSFSILSAPLPSNLGAFLYISVWLFVPYELSYHTPGQPGDIIDVIGGTDCVDIYPVKMGIVTNDSKGRQIAITNTGRYSAKQDEEELNYIDTGEARLSNSFFYKDAPTRQWGSTKPGIVAMPVDHHTVQSNVDQYGRSLRTFEATLYSNTLQFYNVLNIDGLTGKKFILLSDKFDVLNCTHDIVAEEVLQEQNTDTTILETDLNE